MFYKINSTDTGYIPLYDSHNEKIRELTFLKEYEKVEMSVILKSRMKTAGENQLERPSWKKQKPNLHILNELKLSGVR